MQPLATRCYDHKPVQLNCAAPNESLILVKVAEGGKFGIPRGVLRYGAMMYAEHTMIILGSKDKTDCISTKTRNGMQFWAGGIQISSSLRRFASLSEISRRSSRASGGASRKPSSMCSASGSWERGTSLQRSCTVHFQWNPKIGVSLPKQFHAAQPASPSKGKT